VNKARRNAAFALALLGLWHLALRAHGRGVPLITDEGEYTVAARTWSEGGLPYRDAFSQKPPIPLLLYRLPIPPRATAVMFSLATMLVLFLMLPSTLPLAVRLAAPAAYASLSTLPVGDYGFPANTEGFLNLFTALSMLFLLRKNAALSGVFAGAALMTKQTSVHTVFAVYALTLAFQSRRALAQAVLASLAVPASFLAYFAARGALAPFWDCVFAGNARYAAVLLMTGALSGQVRWFLTGLLPRFLLYGAPALALLAWGLSGLKAGKSRPVETAAVLWLGTAVAGALTGLFLFPHYFLQAAPALALCAALGVARLPESSRAAAVLLLAVWPALTSPRLYFRASPAEVAVRLLYPNPLLETRALGRELARRAGPADRLYVFGSEGALYVYSGLRPATRHTLSYGVTLFPKDQDTLDRELSDLGSVLPRFIVWSCQPLSTLISNEGSRRFAQRLRGELLTRSYAYQGAMPVTGGPPLLREPAKDEKPDFEPGDRLLLFERRP
jgi:hypothetical protein